MRKGQKKVYIELAVIRDRLQARMQYKNPDNAFKVLMICFEKAKKYPGWARNVRRRGFSTRAAKEFAEYVGYPIHES